MTTPSMTTRARRIWGRWLVRAALIGAALALMVNAFVQSGTARAQYDPVFYKFCVEQLGQGRDYCCAHAGGVVRDGQCVEPD